MKPLIFSILVGWLGSSLGWAQSLVSSPSTGTDQAGGFHVVVIGSSTAEGIGPGTPRDAWVNRLRTHLKQQIPGSRVTNLALGGYVSYQLLPNWSITPPQRPRPDRERNITMALSLKPSLIILNLPSNDEAAGYELGEQKLNYRRIVMAARNARIPIYVCTTQPRVFSPEKVARQEAMRDWVFKTYGEKAIDFWSSISDCAGWPREEFDSGDGTHLNGEAHAVLYERVLETIPWPSPSLAETTPDTSPSSDYSTPEP